MMRPIQRRTFLKGTGVTLALPYLESMQRPLRSTDEDQPRRLVFLCTALGLHPPNLWPSTTGNDYESTPYLELLRDHRSDMTLFSGLSHEDQTGRQPHDSEMTWLTAARKPGMGGFRNSISIDQVAASQLGSATRFSSLTLGTLKQQSQSYTSGGVMIPARTSPADLFASLFMEGTPEEVQAQRARLNDGQSILDELGSQSNSLKRRASSSDHHLLDDYFESVRQAELNIRDAQGWMDRPKPEVDDSPPADIHDPADLLGRTKLMIDLIPIILKTDSTRVISLMVQDHFAVPKIDGVSGNHHNLSHHGQDPSKIEQLERIESGLIGCVSDLLYDLKQHVEQGSSLLDQTSVLFGSNLGNANAHHARNLPIILAGGDYPHGQYVAKEEGTPLCNLFVRMLRESNLEVEGFGQSSGSLDW